MHHRGGEMKSSGSRHAGVISLENSASPLRVCTTFLLIFATAPDFGSGLLSTRVTHRFGVLSLREGECVLHQLHGSGQDALV